MLQLVAVQMPAPALAKFGPLAVMLMFTTGYRARSKGHPKERRASWRQPVPGAAV